MTTHASILAWKIPWTEEPGGLQSTRLKQLKRLSSSSTVNLASQATLVVKNLPASAGDIRMQVLSLGREDPLEEGMATHSSILAWKIPWTEKPGGLQSMGSQRVQT